MAPLAPYDSRPSLATQAQLWRNVVVPAGVGPTVKSPPSNPTAKSIAVFPSRQRLPTVRARAFAPSRSRSSVVGVSSTPDSTSNSRTTSPSAVAPSPNRGASRRNTAFTASTFGLRVLATPTTIRFFTARFFLRYGRQRLEEKQGRFNRPARVRMDGIQMIAQEPQTVY